jgi:general secretion pathway protein C
VGIVATDDAAASLAIIEHKKTSEQKVYSEGDRVGGILIKRILPGEVIVDAGKGERRLRLRTVLATGGARVSQYPVPGQSVRQASKDDRPNRGRRQTIHLSYPEAASELGDVDRILREVELSPVKRLGQPAGFRVSSILPGSILSRMGLHNGDIVKRLDQWEITSPEQAAEFLQRISHGGQLTLTVNKRRRTRHIILNIQ